MAYTIKSGDTLSKIASQNGTTVSEILRLNPSIKDPNKISAGASLNLPNTQAPRSLTDTLSAKYMIDSSGQLVEKPATTTKTITQQPQSATTTPRTVSVSQQSTQTFTTPSGAVVDVAGNIIRPAPSTGAPASKPSSDPEVSSLLDSLVGSDPFLNAQLSDPAKRAMFDSMPASLQGTYLNLLQVASKRIESGQVINPNIEITPTENQKFLDQATTELDPYYQEQIGLIKKDLTESISRLATDYNTAVGRAADPFKQTLESQAASEAEAGTAFSSGRVEREAQTVQGQQQKLDDLTLATTRAASDVVKNAERRIGSQALSSLGIPSINLAQATNTGLSPTGSRTLTVPSGDVAIGDIGKERKVAVEGRRSQLEEGFRKNRILNVSPL